MDSPTRPRAPRLTRRRFGALLAGGAAAAALAPLTGRAAAPDLRERIGIDLGAEFPLADAVRWAASHGVRYVDVTAALQPELLRGDRPKELERIAALRSESGVQLGLHTRSAVNSAEVAPYVSAAVDAYLRAYVDLARAIGAGWVIVHAGYHFTDDRRWRLRAATERLARIADHAHERGVRLLLENHNPEPAGAEIDYLGRSIEECRHFLEAIAPDRLGWAFTANHAHMTPEGVNGFLDALGTERIGEVRLADTRGEREEHLPPGEGTLDFAGLFDRLESSGYRGHYALRFGDAAAMLRARDELARLAA